MTATITRNFIFDIDGILCCHEADEKSSTYFLRKGAVLTVDTTHYIFPGVIECMQLLYSTPNVRVSFFSSAKEDRNVPFVKQLLLTALGKERYAEVADSVQILSRKHLASSSQKDKKEQIKKYSVQWGKKKKDISPLVRSEDSIKDAIIIDDNSSYIFPGQEANFLVSPEMDEYSLSGAKDHDRKHYDRAGYKQLKGEFFVLADKEELSVFRRDQVLKGRCFYLIRRGSSYNVVFVEHLTGKVVEKEINMKEHEGLLELLEPIEEREKEQKYGVTISNEKELLEKLHQIIKSHNGRITTLFKTANRVCYFTGLIFLLMESAENNSTSLSEELFKLQYREAKEPGSYERHNPLFSDDRIYELGLRKLQEVNPQFHFHTPTTFDEVTQVPLKDAEAEQLAAFRANEVHEECRIM